MYNVPNGCPFHAQMAEKLRNPTFAQDVIFSLKNIPDVLPFDVELERDILSEFKNWAINFLCQPNLELGRKGSVCPFTKKSLQLDRFWINFQTKGSASTEEIKLAMLKFKTAFLALNTGNESEDIFNTLVIIFSKFPSSFLEKIDIVQKILKPQFVHDGLMIGQFYPGCSEPGLRNKHFRPLNTTLPFLVIRNMVQTDWEFLKGDDFFEKSYLKKYPKGSI